MKIDPLVLHLCEKADRIALKILIEKDQLKKAKLLLAEIKYLKMAAHLQKSSNCVALASFVEMATMF